MSSTSEDVLFDFGVDPDLEELTGIKEGERVAVIRTSDRSNFRRCRRRWGWQSHLRGNLTPIESASPLWFGSGIHYALEDLHGPHKYRHSVDAFKAYVKATHGLAKARNNARLLPYDWPDLYKLGIGMLEYYQDLWLVARDPLQTFIVDGKPQVEVHALVPVPFETPHYDKIFYAVTLDRIIIDEHGGLWIVDYKTAKQIQTHFFQTDPQISAYCWIARQLYDRPISGFIYQQHRKTFPSEPAVLASGRISTSKNQLTSHRHYRKSLINLYGNVMNAPAENIDFLNRLVEQETDSADKFVRRDKVFRNEHQAETEGVKLMMELEEMLNPDLPLYPSPTRDCGHLCSFQSPCISMDDGGDWEYELQIGYQQKEAQFDNWREYLP